MFSLNFPFLSLKFKGRDEFLQKLMSKCAVEVSSTVTNENIESNHLLPN